MLSHIFENVTTLLQYVDEIKLKVSILHWIIIQYSMSILNEKFVLFIQMCLYLLPRR